MYIYIYIYIYMYILYDECSEDDVREEYSSAKYQLRN